jgi:hypothetical protein
MHLTHTITPSREAEEDPEYGFCEETKADVMHLSLEKLQLLACELRGGGTHPQAIELPVDPGAPASSRPLGCDGRTLPSPGCARGRGASSLGP